MAGRPGKKAKELTQKQRAYCRERAKGKSQRNAYKAAYDAENMKDSTIDRKAYDLELDPKIKAELDRLTALADAGAVLDRRQRIAILSQMAMDETRKDENRQRALDMLNRMNGDYTDKVITEVDATVSMTYEEKRRAVLDALRADHGKT